MSPSYIHSSNPSLAVAAVGGRKYWLQATWATEKGLLEEPPTAPRTAANFHRPPPLWVGEHEPTHATPAIIRAVPAWWQGVRERERTLFCDVDWRGSESGPWIHLTTLEFVVNHAPDAVTVPEQVIALDAAGAIAADVRLDGTASDDVDVNAAPNPAGPLALRWSPVQTPPTLAAGGAVAAAAGALADTADPLFLAAGTVVPASDRGAYTFRLTVDDRERATIGARAGQSRTASADARVIVGAPAGPGVSIVTPSASARHFANFEDGVDVVIAYRVDPALTGQASYANGWRLKCTITQALTSPVAFSSAVGTTVFETTTVPVPGRVEYLRWDGRDPAAAGLPCAGAFSVRLELLDHAGAATGPPGAAASEPECVVIDYVRWLLPVDCAPSQAMLSGAFMETGHAGILGTGLHGGMDVSRVGQPNLRAARSGIYTFEGGPTATIRLDHPAPDRTVYRHGDTREPHADGDLVLQGERLARMADVGAAGQTHLHFEHHTTRPSVVVRNPLGIVALWDTHRPVIEAVYVRQAGVAGAAASLANASAGIAGWADLVVRCRDRAHPGRDTVVDNGPYRVSVQEKPVAVAVWPERRFDAFGAADHVRDFFAQQGLDAVNAVNHYLPYLRWDTTAYGGQGGRLWIDIVVADHAGQTSTIRSLTLGPEATLVTPPPSPATTSAAPQPFTLEIEVTNHMARLNDDPADSSSYASTDDFHIRLDGAPAAWTVSPTRTGPIGNGATAATPWGGQPPPQRVLLTIDPHGVAAAGLHAFEVTVVSNILRQVGVRVPVTAVVS
jgi:hypothetical protein